MYDYEQSNNERGMPRTTNTRQSVYKSIADRIDREKYEKENQLRHQMRLAQQGNGKYIMNGSNDRVNGIRYDEDNATLYKTEEDKMSYYYGYAVHGLRRIEALVWTLEKEGKVDEVIEIGYREGSLNLPEEILGNLVNNNNYMEGYNSAKKGKGSR